MYILPDSTNGASAARSRGRCGELISERRDIQKENYKNEGGRRKEKREEKRGSSLGRRVPTARKAAAEKMVQRGGEEEGTPKATHPCPRYPYTQHSPIKASAHAGRGRAHHTRTDRGGVKPGSKARTRASGEGGGEAKAGREGGAEAEGEDSAGEGGSVRAPTPVLLCLQCARLPSLHAHRRAPPSPSSSPSPPRSLSTSIPAFTVDMKTRAHPISIRAHSFSMSTPSSPEMRAICASARRRCRRRGTGPPGVVATVVVHDAGDEGGAAAVRDGGSKGWTVQRDQHCWRSWWGAGASCGRGNAKRRGAWTRRVLTAQSTILQRFVAILRPSKKLERKRAAEDAHGRSESTLLGAVTRVDHAQLQLGHDRGRGGKGGRCVGEVENELQRVRAVDVQQDGGDCDHAEDACVVAVGFI
ncbi:hypothetical protein B0H13DRAFT_1933847, partial [Mycena leptocephala]